MYSTSSANIECNKESSARDFNLRMQTSNIFNEEVKR